MIIRCVDNSANGWYNPGRGGDRMKTDRKRMFYLDVARVIAIISITLNHAVNRSYHTYGKQLEEFLTIPLASTLLKVTVYIFSRIGVPLFLMITGVLILNKKMQDASDIKRFYRHNLLSLLITSEIWYFLMYWFLTIGSNGIVEKGWPAVIGGMFSTLLFQNQNTMGSMWYMPMILCVYTTLPFLVIVKDKLKGSGEKLIYLPVALLFLIAMVLPSVNDLLSILGRNRFSSPLTENYLFCYYYIYIIIGYLVGRGALAKYKTGTIIAGGLGSFVISCGYQLWIYTMPADYPIGYNFPLLPVCAGFLFELLRRGADKLRKAEKPITCVSRISFGIYFVHIVIMTALVELLDLFAPGLLHPVRLVVLEVVSVGLSIAVILPLSKIRIFRKYLFMIK